MARVHAVGGRGSFGGSPFSFELDTTTLDAGRVLYVAVLTRFPSDVPAGVTFNGVALTGVLHQPLDDQANVTIWRLDDPDLAIADVVVGYFGNPESAYALAVCYDGRDAAGITADAADGEGADVRLDDFPSAADAIVLAFAATYDPTLDATGEMSEIAHLLTPLTDWSPPMSLAAADAPGAPAVDVTFTGTAGEPWVLAAFSLPEPSAGGTFDRTVEGVALNVQVSGERTVAAAMNVAVSGSRPIVDVGMNLSQPGSRTVQPALNTSASGLGRTLPAALNVAGAGLSRTVAAAMNTGTTGERAVPAALNAQTTGERTVGTAINLQSGTGRAVAAALNVSQPGSRTLTARLNLSQPGNRSVPATLDVDLGSPERRVPAAIHLAGSASRVVKPRLNIIRPGMETVGRTPPPGHARVRR